MHLIDFTSSTNFSVNASHPNHRGQPMKVFRDQNPHSTLIWGSTINTAGTAPQRRSNHVLWTAPRTWHPDAPSGPSIGAAQSQSAQAQSAAAPYWKVAAHS